MNWIRYQWYPNEHGEMGMYYFDSAASCPILPCALTAFLKAPQGNPNSAHEAGRAARNALEVSRSEIAECLDCDPSEIVFTSGSTEACNLGVKILADSCCGIACTDSEHHAVSEAVDRYPAPDASMSKIGIAAMLVNNETGAINNVREEVTDSAEYAHVMTDATAAVGHIPVSFRGLGVSMLAFGGHKFGAPKGIGALLVKDGIPVSPALVGGGQESGRRAGTQSVPLICAMAAALRWQTHNMERHLIRIRNANKRMRAVLGESFVTTLPDKDVGNIEKVSPYILSGRFPGVSAQALVAAASSEGVCISAGSACASGTVEPSPALIAAGLTKEQALETIRISFSHWNSQGEIDEAAEIIRECAAALKSLSQ